MLLFSHRKIKEHSLRRYTENIIETFGYGQNEDLGYGSVALGLLVSWRLQSPTSELVLSYLHRQLHRSNFDYLACKCGVQHSFVIIIKKQKERDAVT